MATNYTVLAYEKGTDGYVIVGQADTNTPKQAVESVLSTKTTLSEGNAVAVPTRSWKVTPYKLVTKPKLELG